MVPYDEGYNHFTFHYLYQSRYRFPYTYIVTAYSILVIMNFTGNRNRNNGTRQMIAVKMVRVRFNRTS